MEEKAALEEARLRTQVYLIQLRAAGVNIQAVLLRKRGRHAADANARLTRRLARLEGAPPSPPAPAAPQAEQASAGEAAALVSVKLTPVTNSPVTLIRLKPDSPRRDSTDYQYLDPPLPPPSLRLEAGLGEESASRRATASPQPPAPPPRASIDGAGRGFRWLVAQQQQLGLGLQLKLEQQHKLREEVNRALRLAHTTLADLEADLDPKPGGDSQSASRRSTLDLQSASRRATASPPLLPPPPSSWSAAAEGGGGGAEGGGGGGGGGGSAAAEAAAWLSEAMRSAEGAEAEDAPSTDNTEPAPSPADSPPVDSKPPTDATEPPTVERSNSFVGSLLSAGHRVFTSFGRSSSPPGIPAADGADPAAAPAAADAADAPKDAPKDAPTDAPSGESESSASSK